MAHGVIVSMRVVMRIVNQHRAAFEAQESTAIGTRKMVRRQNFRRRSSGDDSAGEQQHVIGFGRFRKIMGCHHHGAARSAFFSHDIEDPLSTD